MSKSIGKKQVYLSIDEELETRIQVGYAATLKKRRESSAQYSKNEYLASLVRFALDHQDNIVGSRVALANRVGDRIDARLNNNHALLVAVFHFLSTTSNTSPPKPNESLKWAADHAEAFEQRIAALLAKAHPIQSDDDLENDS